MELLQLHHHHQHRACTQIPHARDFWEVCKLRETPFSSSGYGCRETPDQWSAPVQGITISESSQLSSVSQLRCSHHWPRAVTIASQLDNGHGLSHECAWMAAMALVLNQKLQNPPEVEIWYVQWIHGLKVTSTEKNSAINRLRQEVWHRRNCVINFSHK